jgi:hypothetical protein
MKLKIKERSSSMISILLAMKEEEEKRKLMANLFNSKI